MFAARMPLVLPLNTALYASVPADTPGILKKNVNNTNVLIMTAVVRTRNVKMACAKMYVRGLVVSMLYAEQ